MRIHHSSSRGSKQSGRVYANSSARRSIMAAGEDDDMDFGDFEPTGADDEFSDEGDIDDTLDDMADNIEDMQDDLDELQEDDVNIEVENNIEGHYIAECEKCHGIFISAMVESDQEVEKITGVCPLCEKESDQYLRWVVHAVE